MAQNRRRQLRELYARVPSANCQGICVDSCGPIEGSDLEMATLRKQGIHLEPRAVSVARLAAGEDYTCPALVDGACTVYDDRPLICRLWGVTEGLPCPYGCEPDEIIPDPEAFGMLAESLKIGGNPSGAPMDPDTVRQAAIKHSDGWLSDFRRANRPRDQR